MSILQKDLPTLLSEADPKALLETRLDWIGELVEWIRLPVNPEAASNKETNIQNARLKFLFLWLSRNPEIEIKVRDLFSRTLLETSALPLFAYLGLNQEKGFAAELLDRISKRLLPRVPDSQDLGEIMAWIFNQEGDAYWILALSPEVVDSIWSFMTFDKRQQIEDHLFKAMVEALPLLALHAGSLGLSRDLLEIRHEEQVSYSPFMKLSQNILSGEVPAEKFKQVLIECREKLQNTLENMEVTGVSVAMIHRVEVIGEILDRLESLCGILHQKEFVQRKQQIVHLVATLAQKRLDANKVSTLIDSKVHLLSRKIVERAGASGEHYITTNSKEYVGMLKSAAGGGVVTAGTTIVKFIVTSIPSPLFFYGFLSWINYAGSFLFMQACHFSLASKQPSMTASALANKLIHLKSKDGLFEFVQEVMRITRSQFAATVGNLGMVIPVAFLLDFIFFKIVGLHVLSSTHAVRELEALHPWKSGTLFYAAWTGVILWLSSICAGWLENWVVLKRLPEALAKNRRLKRIFGVHRMQRFAGGVLKNASGVGGNVSIGFFLAYTPVFAKFFGLALEVRHVTLSTGALTFALCAIRPGDVEFGTPLMAVVGIFCIGILNFGVSFFLALFVALKARDVKPIWVLALFQAVRAQFFLRPLDFFFPPRDSASNVETSVHPK